MTLDGSPVSAKTRAKAGQRLFVRPAPPPPSAAWPQDLPLNVLYEDEDLIVVNKAAGMVVHPAPGHPDGTLVNALLHHFGVLPGEDPMRPGIVHRLDAHTSGVMVVARSVAARSGLMKAFAAHELERSYSAICLGRPPKEHTFSTLHGRHPHHRIRFSSQVTRGKKAITHLRLIRPLHGSSLIRCQLETGRTHQIRVHLADAGHPLLGDPLYGRDRARDTRIADICTTLGRQALHAGLLAFAHPISGEALRFEAQAPDDFQVALQALEL